MKKITLAKSFEVADTVKMISRINPTRKFIVEMTAADLNMIITLATEKGKEVRAGRISAVDKGLSGI